MGGSESVLEVALGREESRPLLKQDVLQMLSASQEKLGLGSLDRFLFEQVAVL